MSRKKSINVLLTLILATAVLLTASLMSLGKQATQANSSKAEVQKRHPQLYVAAPGVFEEPAEPTVYFTFDDGPSHNTEVLLDMLLQENIKATFFVCAQGDDKEYMQMLLRRMRDEGHTIGLHTYSHRYEEVYASIEAYLDDLAAIDAFVYEATGMHPNILRFPGGSATRNCDKALMKQIADEVTRRGYVFYDWTVPSGDDGASAAPVEVLTKTIIDGVKQKQVEIILCHDNPTPTTTPEAVQASIAVLRQQGYRFDRLTNTVPPIQRVYEK